MGLLQNGQWAHRSYDTEAANVRFVNRPPSFRNWVTADGTAGPSDATGFEVEAGGYHLHVSLACPCAHWTSIFYAIKALQGLIDIWIVRWLMDQDGSTLMPGDGATPDPINKAQFLDQIYIIAKSNCSGGVTMPVLGEKQKNVTVSNESYGIMRMFNYTLDDINAMSGDSYLEPACEYIDAHKTRISDTSNNCVNKAGFASTQDAHQEVFDLLFEQLDWLDDHLSTHCYSMREHQTEVYWWLLTTFLRFSTISVGHLKCNLPSIEDYLTLSGYVRDLYQRPSVVETVDIAFIKKHYYCSHETVNPTREVSRGPPVNFAASHNRAALSGQAVRNLRCNIEQASKCQKLFSISQRTKSMTSIFSRRLQQSCGPIFAAMIFILTAVMAQAQSSTEVQLHYGDGFKIGRNGNPPTFDNTTARQIITLEHFSLTETGDLFFFVDFFRDIDTDPSFAGRESSVYGEIYYHFSGKNLGLSFGDAGFVKAVDFAVGLNQGTDLTIALAGPRFSFNVRGFRVLTLGIYGYKNITDPFGRDLKTTAQATLIWDVPFEVFDQKFQFKGFTDFIGAQGSGFANQIVFSPQIRWDLGYAFGGQESKVQLGIEYTHFRNKFGNEGVDEDAVSVFAAFKF